MGTQLLRCEVRPGMFDTEFLVLIDVPGRGVITSFFVDKHHVEVEEAPTRERSVVGRLRVNARVEGEGAVVMLPVQASDYHWIDVPKALLAN
jgi:hypothetical protein